MGSGRAISSWLLAISLCALRQQAISQRPRANSLSQIDQVFPRSKNCSVPSHPTSLQPVRNFRDFNIWKGGMDLALEAYRIVNKLPKEEEFGLKSQIKRAAVSIPSNIAEGCSRSSEKEFKRFLEISLGSSFEVETDFLLASKLEMISDNDLAEFFQALHSEQRQINALISKIREK